MTAVILVHKTLELVVELSQALPCLEPGRWQNLSSAQDRGPSLWALSNLKVCKRPEPLPLLGPKWAWRGQKPPPDASGLAFRALEGKLLTSHPISALQRSPDTGRLGETP